MSSDKTLLICCFLGDEVPLPVSFRDYNEPLQESLLPNQYP